MGAGKDEKGRQSRNEIGEWKEWRKEGRKRPRKLGTLQNETKGVMQENKAKKKIRLGEEKKRE